MHALCWMSKKQNKAEQTVQTLTKKSANKTKHVLCSIDGVMVIVKAPTFQTQNLLSF